MRGRNRTKGPNPLTRTYESNGPDVKIRGTAQHIADKYAQLARDATVSGDPVSAENYLQHAEHYYRMIAAAQEAYRQQFGTQQRPFDDEGEEGDEDGQGFGYGPGERGQAGQGEEFSDGFPGQPYEGRPSLERPQQARFDRGDQRHDRQQERGNDRQGERGFDRQGERGPRPDRSGERFDRGGDRPDRNGERFDRNAGGRPGGNDRFDRPANGSAHNGERYERSERQDNRGDRPGRGDGPRGDGPRGEGGRREFGRNDRMQGQPRAETPRFSAPDEESREAPAAALPAFLTTPVRTPTVGHEEDREMANGASVPFGEDVQGGGADRDGPAEPRPRRARRPRRTEGPAGGLELVAPPLEPDTSGE